MTIDFEELFRERNGRGGADRPTPNSAGIPGGRRFWLLLFILLTSFMALSSLGRVYIDWLWFESLGQSEVFRERLLAPATLFGIAWLLGALVVGANWFLALRRTRQQAEESGNAAPAYLQEAAGGMVLLFTVLVAAVLALRAGSYWPELLLYRTGTRFGVSDPLLGREVGFYVFELPLWRASLALMSSWIFAAAVGAALIYVTGGVIEAGGNLRRAAGKPGSRVRVITPGAAEGLDRVRAHLMSLGALYCLVLAAGQWLARYDLPFVDRGADGTFYGAGYADAGARLRAFGIVALLWALAALALLLASRMRLQRAILPAAVVGVALISRILLGEVYPGLVQEYRVKPNELDRETPFIEHNIRMTNAAYGLTRIEGFEYEPEPAVLAAALEEHVQTLDNVRLWDWRVLLDFFDQKQSIRPYYDFIDVDIDRYETQAGQRQVELSARELNPDGIRNPNWISRHLEYTHGFGLALAPVDEVDRRGQPVLWARDLPVRSSGDLGREIEEPRIYFGESDANYVIVNTTHDEFDYPVGEDNARTNYAGRDGIPVASRLRRLIFTAVLGDTEILLSDKILPESRVLIHRNILERVQKLAPFLRYDNDPYLVVTDEGRLVWILDAYTVSDRYPYSQPVRLEDGTRVNYIRNSVKVVVDAYEGSVTFYVVDEEDPLIEAWSQIFPSLFTAASEMGEDLVAHWRYPETLFRAQAGIYARYHMVQPAVFYNGEDLWAVPMETRGQNDTRVMQPYYVTMRLRGEQDPEFLLMLPFTPAGKKNMIAWLAARSDPEHYGELVLYNFGKGRQVDGPEQIESRIDNNTDISAQLTLWSQAGSQTIRGNLLVIPLGDALLYVEPLYLQAESNALPELKRVIVADGDRVEMRETLDEALQALVGAEDAPRRVEIEAPDEDDEPLPSEDAFELPELTGDVVALVAEARARQDAAAAALAEGDWLRFGREMDGLARALDRLGGATGDEERIPIDVELDPPGDAGDEGGDGEGADDDSGEDGG